jgi:ABC-type glycerol-3-phosphate transport system substrate-binding protein
VKWAVSTGYLPVRQSAKDEVIAAFQRNPQWGPVARSYARIFNWLQYAMVESPVAGYDPVRTIIDQEVMSRVINDPNVDVKKLLDDAVAKANEILRENAPKSGR